MADDIGRLWNLAADVVKWSLTGLSVLIPPLPRRDHRHAYALTWTIRHEALFDQYTVTTPRAQGAAEVSLATWEALDRHLSREALILARPGGRGTYYFHVRLEVTTLSTADLDELERFVRGESTTTDRERNPTSRSVLQFLMRMTGGLQSERVEQRTEKFVVP